MTMRAAAPTVQGIRLLSKSFSDTAVNSVTTAVDFDVLTVSIPSGTVAAGNQLRWKLLVQGSAPSATTNWRIRFKLGSTTIFSTGTPNVMTVTSGSGLMNVELVVGFTTISTQRAAVRLDSSNSTSATLVTDAGWQGYDTASVDFSSTQNLVLVGNASYASGTPTCTVLSHTLELLS